MPAIRSDLRKSRKIRRFSNLFSAKRPEWDNELDDEIIPTSKLGAGPFENISEADEELEFDNPSATVPIPTDPRPPRFTLGDLEGIKTLGGSQSKVLLVRLKRKCHRLDSECLFALKAISRKSVRENSVGLTPEVSEAEANGGEIAEARKGTLIKAQKKDEEVEVSILAKLPWHPFITGLVDTFYDSQHLYLALEYAPHGTLRSLLQRGGMKPRNANFYFANIVAAVDFLHSRGIVHRDLKPENILLNSDGYLCLTGFSSACSLEDIFESPKLDRTCAYMAPEWHQDGFEPTLLDWWSCGCILFEMATGKVAFVKKEKSVGLAWPLTARVGKHLRDLIERLLDADPCKRLGHNGSSDIADHPWLKDVDWEKMLGRHYLPPFIPRAPQNCDRDAHCQSNILSPV